MHQHLNLYIYIHMYFYVHKTHFYMIIVPSQYNSNILRKLQQTHGTYPRPSTTCLWRKSLHICVLGYLGSVPRVCWNFLRNIYFTWIYHQISSDNSPLRSCQHPRISPTPWQGRVEESSVEVWNELYGCWTKNRGGYIPPNHPFV